jgi:hypothetical protein
MRTHGYSDSDWKGIGLRYWGDSRAHSEERQARPSLRPESAERGFFHSGIGYARASPKTDQLLKGVVDGCSYVHRQAAGC